MSVEQANTVNRELPQGVGSWMPYSEQTTAALKVSAKEIGWVPKEESDEEATERIQKDFVGLCEMKND